MKEKSKIVNMDKAEIKTNSAIGVMVLSLITYIIPIILGTFDFGVIFEAISFIFLIISRQYMSSYKVKGAKKFIIFSIASIGWILIYDAIILISRISDIVDMAFFGIDYWFADSLSLIYIIILILAYKDLEKAENPTQYKESTDWFYEE